MSDKSMIDEPTTLWLVLSPTAKELVGLSRDSLLLERRFCELAGHLTSVDKCFILPYLRLAAAKRFKSTLGEERRARLEEF